MECQTPGNCQRKRNRATDKNYNLTNLRILRSNPRKSQNSKVKKSKFCGKTIVRILKTKMYLFYFFKPMALMLSCKKHGPGRSDHLILGQYQVSPAGGVNNCAVCC